MRNIVIFAPNWLGDAVMALPAIADVRRHFSEAELTIAARQPLAPLFRSVDGVNAVVTLAANGLIRRAVDRPGDARRLASDTFEVALLLPNSFSSAWLAWRAGIPERWGYRSDLRGALLTRTVARPRGARHQAAYYQELTRALGISSGPCEPRVRVSDEARGRAAELLASEGVHAADRLIGIAPGAAYGHAKRWPSRHFAELIGRLAHETAAKCALVGSAADREAGREVVECVARSKQPTSVINLIGRTDLPLLIGVMSHCRAFVSNDSGAMHLAAASGLPVTALFGPTDERATSPLARSDVRFPHEILTHAVWCRPCMLRECPIDHRCMTGISTSAAFEALGRQLDPSHVDEASLLR